MESRDSEFLSFFPQHFQKIRPPLYWGPGGGGGGEAMLKYRIFSSSSILALKRYFPNTFSQPYIRKQRKACQLASCRYSCQETCALGL